MRIVAGNSLDIFDILSFVEVDFQLLAGQVNILALLLRDHDELGLVLGEHPKLGYGAQTSLELVNSLHIIGLVVSIEFKKLLLVEH